MMNKFKLYALGLAFLGLGALASCDTAGPAPLVTVTTDATSVSAGDVVAVTITVTAENGLTQLVSTSPSSFSFLKDYTDAPLEATETASYTVTAADVADGKIMITISATDDDALISTGTAELTYAAPAVTMSDVPTTGVAGSSVDFTVDVTSVADLASFWVKGWDSNGTEVTAETWSATITANQKTASYRFNRTLSGAVDKYTFYAKDVAGTEVTKELDVTLDQVSEVVLGSFSAVEGSFYSLSTKSVKTMSQTNSNDADVDFAFSNGSTSGANIFNLGDAVASVFFGTNPSNWETKKNTMFRVGAAADYDATTISEIEAGYNEGTGSTRITNLEVGSVFFIKEASGKYFVAKVTALTTGGLGKVTLAIKGQF